ncbi:unnamed protein product, partial [Thlaspi arvense]
MATWRWLEDINFEHIFSILTALSDLFIMALADEATLCFSCLEFTKQKKALARSLYSSINRIYSRIFFDIILRVLPSSSTSSCFTNVCGPLNIPGFPHPTFGSINVMPHISGDGTD